MKVSNNIINNVYKKRNIYILGIVKHLKNLIFIPIGNNIFTERRAGYFLNYINLEHHHLVHILKRGRFLTWHKIHLINRINLRNS